MFATGGRCSYSNPALLPAATLVPWIKPNPHLSCIFEPLPSQQQWVLPYKSCSVGGQPTLTAVRACRYQVWEGSALNRRRLLIHRWYIKPAPKCVVCAEACDRNTRRPSYLLVECVPVVNFLSHGVRSRIVVEVDQLWEVVGHDLRRCQQVLRHGGGARRVRCSSTRTAAHICVIGCTLGCSSVLIYCDEVFLSERVSSACCLCFRASANELGFISEYSVR